MIYSNAFKGIHIDDRQVYLDKKLEDHRMIMALMYVFCPLFAMALWGWDHAIDPYGSINTIGLRMGFLLTFIGYPLIRYVRSKLFLVLTYPMIIVYAITIFLLILNRLDGGMVFGISGFMIYLMLPTIGCSGFSLRVNIISTLVTLATADSLAALGLVDGFRHLEYGVIVWPTGILVIVTQILLSYNYMVRYQLENGLRCASNTDAMTGISNRRHFMPILQEEIKLGQASNETISLLMIDIDHFKRINDSLGHMVGDEVICQVVKVIQKNISGTETLARFGGEEFVIALPGYSIDSAYILAEMIRKDIHTRDFLCNHCDVSVSVTVSIGVAEHQSGSRVDDLISHADNALYRAKANGRNRTVMSRFI